MFERTIAERAQRAATTAERAFAPDVVRVRFRIGTDYNDEPAVFFNVLLSDDAAAASRLGLSTGRVMIVIEGVLDAHEFGWYSYFNHRSVSEQNRRNDPEWK